MNALHQLLAKGCHDCKAQFLMLFQNHKKRSVFLLSLPVETPKPVERVDNTRYFLPLLFQNLQL